MYKRKRDPVTNPAELFAAVVVILLLFIKDLMLWLGRWVIYFICWVGLKTCCRWNKLYSSRNPSILPM
jgi:hypothetical protein